MSSNPTVSDRIPLQGDIDFTMMYVAHDAFSRDLRQLLLACQGSHGWQAAERAQWKVFTKQLHIHHQAEDAALWPQLRGRPLEPEESAVLVLQSRLF